MTLPNFLIIGAWKSGTTSLHHYLNQHHEIFMTPWKQTYFFAFEGNDPNCHGPGDKEHHAKKLIIHLEDYQALFKEVRNEKAIGEACSVYLSHPRAPERIKHHIPEAKLIVNLRNPVETTYSAFIQQRRDGLEPVSDFAEALRLEAKRIQDNWRPMWHYKTRGFYYEQLSRYFRLFDAANIRIYLYQDFLKDPTCMLKDLFTFLEVDHDFTPDMTSRYNVGGVPRNKGLQDFLTHQNRLKKTIKSFLPQTIRGRLKSTVSTARTRNLEKPPLSPELRQELIADFRDDILKLQNIVKKDLSAWLT